MGIKSFSKFLKDNVKAAYFEAPLESFAGKRWAIDMGILMHQMMSVAASQILNYVTIADDRPDDEAIENLAIVKILERLELFLKYTITPVCVYDGKPHRLKIANSNKQKKKKRLVDAAELAQLEEAIYSVDPFVRDVNDMDRYLKLRKQLFSVSIRFSKRMAEITKAVGFPTLTPENYAMISKDAEALCATLCIDGNKYCDVAYTTDTDFHVYGGNIAVTEIAPRCVTEMGKQCTKYFVRLRALETILVQSNLTFVQFQDLCILMGTDYNPNVKGMGPVKCTNNLRKYGSVEAMAKHINLDVINYYEVKTIFTSSLFKLIVNDENELNFSCDSFAKQGRDVLSQYNTQYQQDTITKLIKRNNEVNVAEHPHLGDTNLMDTLENALSNIHNNKLQLVAKKL